MRQDRRQMECMAVEHLASKPLHPFCHNDNAALHCKGWNKQERLNFHGIVAVASRACICFSFGKKNQINLMDARYVTEKRSLRLIMVRRILRYVSS